LIPGRPFDLTRHRYLVDIYNESARQACFCKAGQMGLSEYAISYALHACDEREATALYVFPTEGHVSDFSSARIGPALEASPYLGSIVIEGGAAGGKRGADRVTLKRVRDRFLYLRGSQVKPDGRAPQLKSVDADVLVLDEIDEMDPRALPIARQRLGHSAIAEERAISTPTYANVGIHAEWLDSDQREWHVRCTACGEWQPLTIDQVVTEWDQLGRPVTWHGGPDDAWVACRKCGQRLDRLGPGRWVPTWPGNAVHGYHLSKLFSPAVRVLDIVERLQTVDETKRKEVFNQDLGLPYSPRGGRLTDEVLDACRREYAPGPVADEQTVLGVDVGKVLHVVIRSAQEDVETGERPQRWAGMVESFAALGNLMQRYNVDRAVVDALPETRKARELQAAFPKGLVWLAYYVTQQVGSKRAAPMQWDRQQGVVNLDRTRTLDEVFAGLVAQTLTLPANARGIPDYYAHLKAPLRVLEDGPGGQKVARYINTSPDHLAHAENYCQVARHAPPRLPRRARSYQG
jgi:phage terminase large subunit GpA-like protein